MKMSFRSGLRLASAAIRLMAVVGLWSALHAWTTPERVDRRPDNYVVYLCDIVAAPDGTPHVVWSECPAGTYYEKIMYARKLQDTWSIPANISRDSGDIRMPAVVVDSGGRLVVVWSEEGAARIRYVRQLGDTWSLPRLCFPNHGITPRIAADSRGRIHLLFEDGNIWHSYYTPEADSWATPEGVASSSGVLGWSSLAVDRFDHLHAVWMNYGTNGIDYSRNDGTGWSAPTPLPDPAPSDQSCEPRITADTAACPHVVWQERAGGYILYYTERSADTWTTPYRLFDQSGGNPLIATDAADRLHVVWGWDYGIRYISRTASGWSDPVSVTDSYALLWGFAQSASRLHVVWTQDWGVWYSEHDLPWIDEEAAAIGLATTFRACRTGSGYRLDFYLASPSDASLELADASGRVARRMRLGYLSRGSHEVELCLDSVPSGVYFCGLHCGSESGTLKLVVNH
jgi:hypothetical protein